MSNDFQHKDAAPQSQPAERTANPLDRRSFVVDAAAGAATLALPRWARADMFSSSSGLGLAAFQDDLSAIRTEVEKRHDESVKRLQDWIRQPSIAAENRGMNEGCELTMRMLRDAGFQQAAKIPTDGQPGIFATLDAGAPRTLGLYYMYDVKQVDPAEWSSPPFEAALVDKPGLGKVVMGRGAVNQKGPEARISRCASRHSRRRQETSRQPRFRRRRRRRNRLAAFSASGAPARSAGRAEKLHGHFHAQRLSGTRRRSHHDSWREGRDRM